MALGKLSKDYPQLDLTRASFLDLARFGKMKSAHDSAVILLQRMCAVHVGMHLPIPTPVHFTVEWELPLLPRELIDCAGGIALFSKHLTGAPTRLLPPRLVGEGGTGGCDPIVHDTLKSIFRSFLDLKISFLHLFIYNIHQNAYIFS